nr:hypothetical protein [Tanacetum cinerariifolium]
MTYTDEMIDSDNTTLIFSRYPDAILYVYTRSHTTHRSSTLPSSLPPHPTRRTARMSLIPVIEPNLAKRARIFVFNFANYQDDPESPPPSPPSTHQIAAYQKMLAEMDPTKRERALIFVPLYGTKIGENSMSVAATSRGETTLTICMTRLRGQLHTTLEDMDSYPATCLEELTVFMTKGSWQKCSGTESDMYLQRIQSSHAKKLLRVKFASSTLLDGALTWWNVYVHSVTLEAAHTTPWNNFKSMFIRKYCPRNEVKQMERELWNIKVKGTDLTAYNQCFQELILLCPDMVPTTNRLLEQYIEGLPLNIKRNITSSKPVDIHEAIKMAQGLMYQVVQDIREKSEDKRKWVGNHYNNSNTNNPGNYNPNKCLETARVFTAGQGSYAGKLPYRRKYGRHHTYACLPTCHNCGKAGHKDKECRTPPRLADQRGPGSQEGQGKDVTCFRGSRAPGGVYQLGVEGVVHDNNVVNGTFLINNAYASVLFDTGADRSFISSTFSEHLNITPTALDTGFDVDIAKGKSLTATTILRGCTLNLQNHTFKINLLPIELGSFNVIIEMEWMSEHRLVVVFYEKYIRIPYKNDVLIVRGERSEVRSKSRLEVILSIKTQKYTENGCPVFLIQVTGKEGVKTPKRRVKDVPVAKDFPEVFPEDLPRLLPTRQVEFHTELIPGAAPVA